MSRRDGLRNLFRGAETVGGRRWRSIPNARHWADDKASANSSSFLRHARHRQQLEDFDRRPRGVQVRVVLEQLSQRSTRPGISSCRSPCRRLLLPAMVAPPSSQAIRTSPPLPW